MVTILYSKKRCTPNQAPVATTTTMTTTMTTMTKAKRQNLYPSDYVDKIVIPNAKCALNENCIAPLGSGLGNHRYDQTTLSILAYAEDVRAPHHIELLAAQRSQLNSDMTKASERIVWTARRKGHFYAMGGY
ncbi:MAG: hypothetical protein ACRDL7_01180 [Gaiellaceae bacterium]